MLIGLFTLCMYSCYRALMLTFVPDMTYNVFGGMLDLALSII